MSTCISKHGEYSSHQLGNSYVCALCGVVDDERRAAAFEQLSSEIRFLTEQYKNVERQRDQALNERDRLRVHILELQTEKPPVLHLFVNPNGCGYCGLDERGHGLRYKGTIPGFHAWTPPTDEQRLERMWQRRQINLSNPSEPGRKAMLRRAKRLSDELSRAQGEREAAYFDLQRLEGDLVIVRDARAAVESALAALRVEIGRIADEYEHEAEQTTLQHKQTPLTSPSHLFLSGAVMVWRDARDRLRALVPDHPSAAPPKSVVLDVAGGYIRNQGFSVQLDDDDNPLPTDPVVTWAEVKQIAEDVLLAQEAKRRALAEREGDSYT